MYIETAFRIATNNQRNLSPNIYSKIESIMQEHINDRRYKLFVLAGTDHSCIVKFRNTKFYLYHDYECKLWRAEYSN